ncbi:hypothetical protein FQN49_004202, partial [Arthroderma sp. PD_2]
MALPFLLSYTPESSSTGTGLSFKQISYFGRVLIKPSSVEHALSFVRENFAQLDICIDATTIAAVGDIVDVLNTGAILAFVTFDQLKGLSKQQNVPSSRLVVFLSSASEVLEFKKWVAEDAERKDVGASCTSSEALDTVISELEDECSINTVYRSYETSASQTTLLTDEQEGIVSVIPAASLSVDKEELSPAKLLIAGAVPDSNTGLYATTVTDERGISLGLVWSSDKSISEAVRTGTGVYQSRKRGLWYKGASSGDIQELVRVGLDCDNDCLIFVVRQKGRGFCHLGTASCFGAYSGLSRLQHTLQTRKTSAPPGSYTSRLFNDPKLLEAKIMEEAEELCQASKKEEVASEAADLIYFALTKCIASGVSLEDVERNLDLKSLKVKRRQGDAKQGWADKVGLASTKGSAKDQVKEEPKPQAADDRITMQCYVTASTPPKAVKEALQRPSQKSNDAVVNL